MQYVEHIEQYGKALFQSVCKLDLEGIVAKHGHGPCITEPQTTWFKIRNRNYSQMEGRDKLFERERHSESVPGWHSWELACAEWSKNMQFEKQLGNCAIEYVASWSDQSLPCGKRAVTRCADCGSSISDCSLECCGRSFCGQCYDYHVKHVCLKKSVQSDQRTQDRIEAA
jgi:hypothetical protein